MRQPIGARLRFMILERDEFTCQYCGSTSRDVKLEVDHINPVYLGGKNDESNLITSCKPCNIGKNKHKLNGILPKYSQKISLTGVLEDHFYQEVAEIYEIWNKAYPKKPMWRMDLFCLVRYKRKNEDKIVEILKQCVAMYKDDDDAYIQWVWALDDDFDENEPLQCNTSISHTHHSKNIVTPLKPTN